jgi:hypothetical protein
MRNIHDVIAEKEAELQQIGQQLDALRLVLRLLSEDVPDRSKAAGPETPRIATPSSPAPKVKVFP